MELLNKCINRPKEAYNKKWNYWGADRERFPGFRHQHIIQHKIKCLLESPPEGQCSIRQAWLCKVGPLYKYHYQQNVDRQSPAITFATRIIVKSNFISRRHFYSLPESEPFLIFELKSIKCGFGAVLPFRELHSYFVCRH